MVSSTSRQLLPAPPPSGFGHSVRKAISHRGFTDWVMDPCHPFSASLLLCLPPWCSTALCLNFRAGIVGVNCELPCDKKDLPDVLVRDLQRNRIKRTYTDIYIYKRRRVIGLGSHHHGGREVPQPAVCALENRKASGAVLVWVKEPKSRRSDSVNPDLSLKAQEPGVPMSEGRRWMFPAQAERVNSLFFLLHLLLYLVP